MGKQTLIQAGNQIISRKKVESIKISGETETYKPMKHDLIANLISEIARKMGYELIKEEFIIARQGMQLVGIITFKRNDSNDCICVGYRNSYDKSASIGVYLGFENLESGVRVFSRSASIKKHTKGLHVSIKEVLVSAIYLAHEEFTGIFNDMERFEQTSLTDDEAYKILGVFFGYDVLSPRQISVVKSSWKSNKKSKSGNLLELYQLCSVALKTSPVMSMLDKYASLHFHTLKMFPH